MATRRKRCMVREMREVTVSTKGFPSYKSKSVHRCDNKIKPGTPFCKEHFATHKLVEVECNGEAHKNPYIDHCMVCMPFWGRYPAAVLKEASGKDWTRESWE